MVAFARTATIRSREPDPRGQADAGKRILTYYKHIAVGPTPAVAVIQDLDGADIGLGAFWGEVNSHIHKGLGCAGVITDGSVRDLDMWASDFFVLAGSIMPSHANVHVVEVGTVVNVAGMIVSPNDVIHADRHGAVVIPAEVVKLVPAAAVLIARREKVIIEASKSPGFSIDRLRDALDEVAEIH
jgi:regulator of RNase E activity RraA